MLSPLVEQPGGLGMTEWTTGSVVARIYALINGLSFSESLVKAASHKVLRAFSVLVIKLSRSFNALSVTSKSFVHFIEQERKTEVFWALTDCDLSLGLPGLFILAALFGPSRICLRENSKSTINHNTVMLRPAMKIFHFQNWVNLFEEIHYCPEILL